MKRAKITGCRIPNIFYPGIIRDWLGKRDEHLTNEYKCVWEDPQTDLEAALLDWIGFLIQEYAGSEPDTFRNCLLLCTLYLLTNFRWWEIENNDKWDITKLIEKLVLGIIKHHDDPDLCYCYDDNVLVVLKEVEDQLKVS